MTGNPARTGSRVGIDSHSIRGIASGDVLSSAERRLAIPLRVLAAVFFAAAAVYALGPVLGPAQDFFREPPFVSNSVVKVTLLGLACLYGSGDVRQRLGVVAIVIAAYIVSVVAMVVALLFGDTGRTVDLGIGMANIGGVLGGAIALDGLITAVLVAFFVPAWRARARQQAASRPRFDELSRPERWLLGLLVGF